MQDDLISRQHFDERVRLAGGMAEEELTQDFKDGVLTVLEMLKTEPSVNPLSVFDDIKAKLQRLADDEWNQNVGNYAQGMSDAIDIIDECMKESEEQE